MSMPYSVNKSPLYMDLSHFAKEKKYLGQEHGVGIQFTLDFRYKVDWQRFAADLNTVHGRVRIDGISYKFWKMINWRVPNERFMSYPLGRIWPDRILVEMTEA